MYQSNKFKILIGNIWFYHLQLYLYRIRHFHRLLSVSEITQYIWTFKRLGKSEIDLVNIFIEGLTKIIQLEQKLEKGEDIAADIASVSLNHTVFRQSREFCSVDWWTCFSTSWIRRQLSTKWYFWITQITSRLDQEGLWQWWILLRRKRSNIFGWKYARWTPRFDQSQFILFWSHEGKSSFICTVER